MHLSSDKKGHKMYAFIKVPNFLISLLFISLLTGCGGGSSTGSTTPPDNNQPPSQEKVTYDDIIHKYQVDRLKNEVYLFPANTPDNEKVELQALKQFDFIFTGHASTGTTDEETRLTTDIIPGTYTHMLMYIGKDSDGLAYGIEMNVDANATLEVDENGVHIAGKSYVYCLGSDGNKKCPKDEYVWGLETYDFLWAKELSPALHDQVMKHKNELLSQVKTDLENKFPFQLPIGFNIDKKEIDLINDGRKNGADCTAYIVLLLEKTAGVCMDNIYVDAAEMRDYYIHDPRGQSVYLPGKYNPVFPGQDLYLSDLLTTYGFSILNNPPRQTACSDKRKVVGIPVPDKILHSSSLIEPSS